MYLLYLDDAGSASNPTERYFALGGICLFERQVHWLSEALDHVVKSAGFPAEETQEIELRGSSILTGKKRWRKTSQRERDRIVRHGLAAIRDLRFEPRLFAAVIDKQARSPEDPVEYAFEQLCNRFDRFLRRKHLQGDTQRGLIIMDNSAKETRLRNLAVEFKTHGHRWGAISNMADVPFFVDSRATRAIQYADLVAHSVWRYFEKNDTQFFNVVEQDFDHEGSVVHGLHHFRDQATECHCIGCKGYQQLFPTRPPQEG